MFMLEAIQVTSQSTIEQVRRIRDGLEDTIDKVRAAAPRIYSKELVETLFVHPYCKIEFIVKSLGVERKAASRYLKELSALGVLQGKKVGRENIYVNTNLMEILSRA